MKATAILEVGDGDTLGTVRAFFGELLRRGMVDGLLVPVEASRNDLVTTELVEDPAQLERANPFAPVLPADAIERAAELSLSGSSRRIGAVLRSCQVRALIELDKMGQARCNALVLIGVDCLGTYEPSDYAGLAAAMGGTDRVTAESLRWASKGQISPYRFRMACQMCETPIPDNVDIAIGLIGIDPRHQVLVTASASWIKRLGLAPAVGDGRPEVIERLVAVRRRRREKVLAGIRETMADPSNLLGWLATCTACRACLEACPLYEAVQLSTQATQTRLPEDNLLGQLIQFSCWTAACVGCGLCESACPAELPLTALFRALGERVQGRLKYVPGRSLSEPVPWNQPSAP
jgi:formate dehydrogenase subunit beta